MISRILLEFGYAEDERLPKHDLLRNIAEDCYCANIIVHTDRHLY